MKGNLILLACASVLFAMSAAACTPATATTAPFTQTPVPTAPAQSVSSTEPTPGLVNTGSLSVSFSADVLPLLESRCSSCHGGQRTEKRLNLRAYEAVRAGSQNGPVVVPGDAGASKLATLVAAGKMPKRGPKLTPAQVQLIVDWINAGAPDN